MELWNAFKILKMSKNPEKYKRLKQMCFLLLKIDEDSDTISLFKNRPLVCLILFIYSIEIIKATLLFYLPVTLQDRYRFGDIVISEKSDQRLFNLTFFWLYFGNILFFYFYIFGDQRPTYLKLSSFLQEISIKQFSVEFNVKEKFVEKFQNEIEKQIKEARIVALVYTVVTYSYYFQSIYQSIKLDYGLWTILFSVCPLTFVGCLGLFFFHTIIVRAFSFYILYLKLIGARVDKLTDELNNLEAVSFTNIRMISNHCSQLNSILKDFELSKHFHERSMVSLIVPLKIGVFFLFPANIILSKNFFTHRLIPHYAVNLIKVCIPMFQTNENFKNAVCKI